MARRNTKSTLVKRLIRVNTILNDAYCETMYASADASFLDKELQTEVAVILSNIGNQVVTNEALIDTLKAELVEEKEQKNVSTE